MKHSLTDVLDNCINDMRQGKTPEQCLAVHADASSELAPLLRTAAFVRSRPTVQASDATMRAGKVAFLQEAARLRAAQSKAPAKPWQRLALVASSTFILPRRRAQAWTPALSLVLAFVLILGTFTTTIAAARSLPDEPLYGIKLAGEQVQMALTTDPVARADLALSNTEKRVDEIAALANQGRAVDAPAIDRLTSETQGALTSIGRIDDDAMRPRLQRYVGIVSQQQAVLSRVQGVASITEAIAAALIAARANEQLAESAINDPSVLRDPAQGTGRGLAATPKESPTALPTPDPRRMRTPVPTATASSTALPTATNTAAPATATLTNTVTPPTPTAAVTSTATVSATALPRVQFSGVIEKIASNEWVIDGKTLHIDAQTRIEGPGTARIGARADVVAIAQPGQALLAISIKVQATVEQPANTVTVRGIILALGNAQWNIGGQTVAVDASTALMGSPALGLIAEATCTRKSSDVLIATTIAIKGAAPEVQLAGSIERITLQSWVIGGQTLTVMPGFTSVSGAPGVGNYATVLALRTDSGALIARLITIQAAPVEEEFRGIINRIDGNGWTISGRRVVRDARTQVDESAARAQVGLSAQVRGSLQADGSILAASVRILAAAGTGRQASPTVTTTPTTVLPTPTATAVVSATVVPPLPTREYVPSPTVATSPTVSPTAVSVQHMTRPELPLPPALPLPINQP